MVFHLCSLGAGYEEGLWLPSLGLGLALVGWLGDRHEKLLEKRFEDLPMMVAYKTDNPEILRRRETIIEHIAQKVSESGNLSGGKNDCR